MTLRIRPVQGRRDRVAFAALPERLNAKDPSWISPLRMEVLDRLSPRHPFFEHGEAAFFLAERGGAVVGRISAQINTLHNLRYKDHVGFFGFFDCVDDPEVAAALLEQAAHWTAERGMDTLRGPFSLSINDECGVLVDGFDTPPYLMMPHNPPYYGRLIEGAGLVKAKDLLAWRYGFEEPRPIVRRFAEAARAVEGVSIREIRPRQIQADVRAVIDVFNDAWSDNWGFVPLTERELAKMAADMKLILDPKIALIAELHGEPIAICIGLPNLNEALAGLGGRLWPWSVARLLWRLKVRRVSTGRLVLLGIRKKYQGTALSGLVSWLFIEVNERARRQGYTAGELSWTLEDNRGINRGIEMMGGTRYKTYRIYERPLGEAGAGQDAG